MSDKLWCTVYHFRVDYLLILSPQRCRTTTTGCRRRQVRIHISICYKSSLPWYRMSILTQDTNSTDEPVTLCVPDTSEMQTHSNRSGPFDVAVVVSCREVNASSSCCGRHARWTTFFSNSRYERTVDVGTCEGQCAGKFIRLNTCTNTQRKTAHISAAR